MQIIDGKNIAQNIVGELKKQAMPQKIFAAVLVGNDPVNESFLKQKEKVAGELGIDFRIYRFPETSTGDSLRKEIGRIVSLKKVGGVLIQLPMPSRINAQYVLNAIPREKDVDVLGERAIGAFYAGRNPVLPPAAAVVEEIIENCKLPPVARFDSHQAGQASLPPVWARFAMGDVFDGKIENLRIAVVGLGFLIGKPISVWLKGKCAEIYLLDKGSDFSILKNADLVISGVGKAGLIKPEMLKDNAGIIDFGYSTDENGKISGDFDTNSLMDSGYSLSFYTPTPGGTGPILAAKIFENFYTLNNESHT